MAHNYSRQREAIRSYLRETTSHPTADMIYRELGRQDARISLATVYRNLALLAGEGEIVRLSGCDGAEHFDGDTSPHSHFQCRICGRIQDVDLVLPAEHLSAAETQTGGRIDRACASFSGVCRECMTKAAQKLP